MFVDTEDYDACGVSNVQRLPYDERLLKRGQLTDQHIDFANRLLKNDNLHIQGLETPLLSATSRGFTIPLKTISTVQIHHADNHWVTSYRQANEDVVYLYDSLLKTDAHNMPVLHQTLTNQLRQMYGSDATFVTVGCADTTQQLNGIDCGVFAIAFATDLCNGHDPGTIKYSAKQMRQHLVKCFTNGKMLTFPHCGSRAKKVTYVDI